MKPKDPSTFIDLGASITRLILVASGQGVAASVVGESAGLLESAKNLLGEPAARAISAERIADDLADQLLHVHPGISEADWYVAAKKVASLIDRLPESDRLAAEYDPKKLEQTILFEWGGKQRRDDLSFASARQAFDLVLEVACRHITDLFSEREALASLLGKATEVQTATQKLLDRPARASRTRDVVNDHIGVLRALAPEVLEDRESEMAALREFVSGSDDIWYAIEADMVSGKTAVMASFASNPPPDSRIVSYFVRRIGGDGNNRGSFAFVMGAQLASILGREYIEDVSEVRQPVEFRELLCDAASKCRDNDRTLVILIDGLDEDSYFEKPDAPDAKSILSLLPRSLPEGVKVITASRPNPRLPEDVECDAKRVAVPLKPSPIAERYINVEDIEKFFKKQTAVDIVAFLAACGDALTVKNLTKLLTMRSGQTILSHDVEQYVERSPGRILTSVDVGSGGRAVLAYRLGHDVVMHAVIRTLDPDSVGESGEPEDLSRVAMIREEVLASYRSTIRDWVKECASRGWGSSTPSYVLSGACFDLMLAGQRDGRSSATTVVDPGRYDEVRRRSGWRSRVLRMIERECDAILNVGHDRILDDVMEVILQATEFRRSDVLCSTYLPGRLGLEVLHFGMSPEDGRDVVMSVDDLSTRIGALREMMIAAVVSGRGRTFWAVFLDVIESFRPYGKVHDGVLRLIVEVILSLAGTASESKTDFDGGVDLEVRLNEVLSLVEVANVLAWSQCSLERGAWINDLLRSDAPFLRCCEVVVEQIDSYGERVVALAEVAGALARAGQTDRAQRVAEHAVNVAGRIEVYEERVVALAEVACVLARAGEFACAFGLVEAIGGSEGKKDSLTKAVGVLGAMGEADRYLDLPVPMERIEESLAGVGTPGDWALMETLVHVADALAREGRPDEVLNVVRRIKEYECCMRAATHGLCMSFEVYRTDRSFDSARYLEDSPKYVQARIKVASVLAETGGSEGRRVAEAAMDELREFGESEQFADVRHEKRVQVLEDVAGVLARMNRIDEACRVVELIDCSGASVRARLGVAGALARAGSVDRARGLAEKAMGVVVQGDLSGSDTRTLVCVADVLAWTNQLEEADLVSQRIARSNGRAQFLVGVMGALAEVGRGSDALRYAATVVCMAGSIEPRILTEVVVVLVELGKLDKARRVAECAEDSAGQIGQASVRAEALVDVAEVWAKLGETDRAFGVANRIDGPEERVQALAGVADARARAGYTDEARDTLVAIDDPSSRSRVQSAIIVALLRRGSSDEAVDVLHAALAEVQGFVHRQDAADSCSTLAATCLEAADLVDSESRTHEQWLGLARSALARSWLYGASVWDRFDVLLRVAPDLAMRLVKERLLADPESGPTPEDPGGEAASSR